MASFFLEQRRIILYTIAGEYDECLVQIALIMGQVSYAEQTETGYDIEEVA
jgi:hypothetical protein